MITILATRNSLGPLWNACSLSSLRSDGSSIYGFTWIDTSTYNASSATAEVPGGFLYQAPGRVGNLRDTGVTHQKADGSITVAVNGPAPYADFDGNRVKSGASYYRADQILPKGNSGVDIKSYPPLIRSDGTYRYEDTGETVRSLETRSQGDYVIAIFAITRPSVFKYRVSTGALVDVLPGTWSASIVISRWYADGLRTWKTGAVSNSSALEQTIQTLLSTGTKGILRQKLASYDTQDLGDVNTVVAEISAHIQSADYAALAVSFDTPSLVDFGELAVEASKSLRYVDDNILLIVQDLVRLGSTAKSLAEFLSSGSWKSVADALKRFLNGEISLGTFKAILKPFMDAYLQWKYAYAPNLGDLQNVGEGIADALFKDRFRRVHSRKVTEVGLPSGRIARHTAVFTAEVSLFGERDWGMMKEIIYLLQRWGLSPETVNLYDLLIYSFVVDWFVQYGDMFEQIDAYLATENRFPVHYCICSEKLEYILDPGEIVPAAYVASAAGSVNVSRYHRWITEDVPLPSVQLTATTSLSKHWAEAGFLVAQRGR